MPFLLSKLSTLSEPKKQYYAVTKPEFDLIAKLDRTKNNGDFGDPVIYFGVYKEKPRLFSVNGCLNPVELYLTLRNHPDDRVQQELLVMLRQHTRLKV